MAGVLLFQQNRSIADAQAFLCLTVQRQIYLSLDCPHPAFSLVVSCWQIWSHCDLSKCRLSTTACLARSIDSATTTAHVLLQCIKALHHDVDKDLHCGFPKRATTSSSTARRLCVIPTRALSLARCWLTAHSIPSPPPLPLLLSVMTTIPPSTFDLVHLAL